MGAWELVQLKVFSPILKGLGLIINDFGLDFHSLMINSPKGSDRAEILIGLRNYMR